MLHGRCFLKEDITIIGIQFKAKDGRPGDLTAFLPEEQVFAVMMWLTDQQRLKLTAKFAWITFHSFVEFHEYFQITDCTDQVSQQYNLLLAKNGLPTIDWDDDREIKELTQ